MPGPRPGAWGRPDRWLALGTYVDLRVADAEAAPRAGALARAALDEVDRTCSRFRAESDLSRANRHAGQWVGVSPVLVGAVRVALEAAGETDGLVDPCLGELIVWAGYDRTFARLRASATPVALPAPVATNRWREVEVRDDAVRVPRGAALDLGATGKAYAADLVAHAVEQALDVATVVSVGGDVRALAPPGRAVGWPVWIAHRAADVPGAVRPARLPADGSRPSLDAGGADAGRADAGRAALSPADRPVEVLLADGGLATSSVTARRWVRGGQDWHHVLDPRTARPTAGPWVTVSAFGATAVAANTASLCALVLGDGAPDWLAHRGVAARLVDRADRIHCTRDWSATTWTAA